MKGKFTTIPKDKVKSYRPKSMMVMGFDLTPKKPTQQDYDNKVIEAYKDFAL